MHRKQRGFTTIVTGRGQTTKEDLLYHSFVSKYRMVSYMFEKRPRSLSGFTFIEMMVVISVFTIAMLAVTSSIVYFYRTNRILVEQSSAINSARKGIQSMVKDMREATYSDEGSFPVIAIATSSFSFYTNTDSDSSIEQVRYFIDDIQLKKGVIEADASNTPMYATSTETFSVVSDDVRNWSQDTSVFQYYDSTGAEITDFSDISDVAFVKTTLIVNVNPIKFPDEFVLRSSATLRNLKTNL